MNYYVDLWIRFKNDDEEEVCTGMNNVKNICVDESMNVHIHTETENGKYKRVIYAGFIRETMGQPMSVEWSEVQIWT